MKEKVELEITYPHPPERVWEALTDAKALSQWLLPADFKPLIGYRFRLQNEARRIHGKVTDVEENKLLAYTWRDDEDGEPSMVVWSLEPVEGGTKVRLEHRALEEPVVNCIAIDNYFNWIYGLRHSLPGLLLLLKGRDRMRVPMVYVEEREAVQA